MEKLDLPFGFSSSFSIAVNSDHSYGALALTRENNAAYYRVWIIGFSGEKITMKEINKINGIDYQTGEDLRFTPNDRYLIYNIPTGNGKLYHFNAREQWFAYDTQTGTSVRGSGKFLRYIHDGNAAILETTSGGKVIDLSTGEDLTRSTDLQDWEKMQVVEMPVRSASHGDLREITLENVFDSKQERVTVRKQVSAYLEKDGYIYSYLHGDKNVECYSIRTGEKFTVPVSKKMLDEIASYSSNIYFNYKMQLNKDGTEILLSYSAYRVAGSIDSVADGQVIAFRDANCLVDMADFVQNNFGGSQSSESGSGSAFTSEYIASGLFNDFSSNVYSDGNVQSDTSHEISASVSSQNKVSSDLHSRPLQQGENVSTVLPQQSLGRTAKLMIGNGYSGLVLYCGGNTIEVFIEDYRDRTFTYYRYWDSLDGFFTIYDDASLPAGIKFRKPLSAGANQQTTKKLYGDLPLAETMYDYAELYTNGKLDGNKVSHVVFNRIADKKLVTEFAIGAYTEDGGGRGASSCEDKTAMYNILKVLAKHDQYHIESDMAGFYRFRDPKKLKGADTRYMLICSVGDYSRDVILGRDSNKKPFICYSDAYYYYITEQEYADLSSQCKQAAAQAKQEHDARTGG